MNYKQETYKFLCIEVTKISDPVKKIRLADALEICREYMEPDITELYKELGLE